MQKVKKQVRNHFGTHILTRISDPRKPHGIRRKQEVGKKRGEVRGGSNVTQSLFIAYVLPAPGQWERWNVRWFRRFEERTWLIMELILNKSRRTLIDWSGDYISQVGANLQLRTQGTFGLGKRCPGNCSPATQGNTPDEKEI